MKPPAAGGIAMALSAALALLTFFQFPGHTWLQQDTQIYTAILEHLRDPSVLANDILAEKPHVAFTLYDEAARLARAATGLSFRLVLEGAQIAARAFGIWGLYLIALALGLSNAEAWLVAAIVSLGATIAGPEVLTLEYEPSPRALALPLVICAIGLAGHRRFVAASLAGAAAFLLHPPTALAFWLVFLTFAAWPHLRRRAATDTPSALLPAPRPEPAAAAQRPDLLAALPTSAPQPTAPCPEPAVAAQRPDLPATTAPISAPEPTAPGPEPLITAAHPESAAAAQRPDLAVAVQRPDLPFTAPYSAHPTTAPSPEPLITAAHPESAVAAQRPDLPFTAPHSALPATAPCPEPAVAAQRPDLPATAPISAPEPTAPRPEPLITAAHPESAVAAQRPDLLATTAPISAPEPTAPGPESLITAAHPESAVAAQRPDLPFTAPRPTPHPETPTATSRPAPPAAWPAGIFLASVAVLLLAARAQAGPGESQALFARLTPGQVQLQHLRTAYIWISTWPPKLIGLWLAVFALAMAAYARIRQNVPPELGTFLVGLPVLGVLSMPASWLLLERAGWSLVPQVQPLRLLLFVALSMQILAAAAGVDALHRKSRFEAGFWFVLAYLLPLEPVVTGPREWARLGLLLALAAATVLARRYAPAVALAAFFAIPAVGGVVNYPRLHTPELAQLSAWARTATARDAVFVFPDAGHALDPGIFRCDALRAVYVDWKGGGQVNFFREFGEQWWFRWQQTVARGFEPSDLPRYRGLGISYAVLNAAHRLPQPPIFENDRYAVYPTPAAAR